MKLDISDVYCVIGHPETLVVSVEETDGECLCFRIQASDPNGKTKVDKRSNPFEKRKDLFRELLFEFENAIERFERSIQVSHQTTTIDMAKRIIYLLKERGKKEVKPKDFLRPKTTA